MVRTGKNNNPRTVSVSTTAILLSDATDPWAKRMLRNTHASESVFLGPATVTSSSTNKGFELKAGEIFTDENISDQIYAICVTGPCAVSVWEIG